MQCCVCRSKAVSDMTSLHVSKSVLGEAMVFQARLVLGFKQWKVTLSWTNVTVVHEVNGSLICSYMICTSLFCFVFMGAFGDPQTHAQIKVS